MINALGGSITEINIEVVYPYVVSCTDLMCYYYFVVW